ncbi:unnamed protein product [Periconia digitata]|uniref:Mid2 domain-containing protein n=1 Tax=Periconia digitata TaxID=1303443 RepID=A0A9W4XL68_9PLEO|nr:unnamed protein product [Periconia digitata]
MYTGRFVSLAVAVSSLASTASATCYSPNNITRQYFQECTDEPGKISMCCALDRPRAFGGPGDKGPVADKCISNGLCMNTRLHVDKNINITEYWRGDCSIETGSDDPLCLRDLCTERSVHGSTALTPCDGTPDSEDWCCGKNTTSCCGTSTAIKLAKVFSAELRPVAVSQSSSPSSSSKPTESAHAVSSNTPAESSNTPAESSNASAESSDVPKAKGTSTGTIVGCVVAGMTILGAVVVGIVIVLMKRRNQKKGPGDGPYANMHPQHFYKHQPHSDGAFTAELSGGAQSDWEYEKSGSQYRPGVVAPGAPVPVATRHSVRNQDRRFELDSAPIAERGGKHGL